MKQELKFLRLKFVNFENIIQKVAEIEKYHLSYLEFINQ